MKKILVIAISMTVMASASFAQNIYQNRSFLTIVPPSAIGVNSSGTTVSASNTTGVAVYSYPGTGALILGINCGDSGNGVITWTSSSTTNIGTVAAYTNGTFVASSNQDTYTRAWTNVTTNAVLPFVPNREYGYIRQTFVASSVTNGSVSAALNITSK